MRLPAPAYRQAGVGRDFGIYPVRNNAPLGFEPFDSAHGPKYVEGSQRLEFLTGFTLSIRSRINIDIKLDDAL
jgi:hypothetical protein